MQKRNFSYAPAAVFLAAALGLAVIMMVTVGLAEGLTALGIVAVLSGAYGLRHYARTRLIYRRRPDPADRELADERQS
ncbi:hypothetical protein ACFQS1_39010 [Paractinoplanes rhizophilus]|jgi:hypothetical protein|uniref:UsfY protein n=1 Tax=Paractinoplanes rhizophilus TaxID=1416877 RepID=A0ABW2I511_9ACTN|nr:hypothetical protein [Actinoplanes sp.]